jgi:NADH dehydrogenase [ubiquinone] 1 alpha subcomplex assembly factor 1
MLTFNLSVFFIVMQSLLIYDFEPGSTLNDWVVINDGVMGGRSRGSLVLNTAGNGVFSGQISLENNGGFSSVRYRSGLVISGGYSKVVLRIKGDGKRYQFRIREKKEDYYSFIRYFDTSGDWQTIELPLGSFYPVFRGRRLNLPNFKGETLEEIGFLIGNNRREPFELEIDYIGLDSD